MHKHNTNRKDTQEMNEDKYILAMYDIRSKQEYIYKSNKMKEIIGASYIIRDCFKDNLYLVDKECGGKKIFNYKEANIIQKENKNPVKEADTISKNNTDDIKEEKQSDIRFTPDNFRKHLDEGYVGEIIYDGGGNFFVLYRDLKAYQEVNKRFYKKLLENTYSLKVLTSYIEGVDFDNFPSDRQKLYEIHRKREQMENLIHPVNALPIVQVDYRDFMPLSCKHLINKREEKVSYESKKKYEKYEKIMAEGRKDNIIQGERILDHIITQKGEESLLAIVYIDGNNMGNKMDSCLSGEKQTYEFCIQRLREYSEEIQKNYIDLRIEDVDRILESKPQQKRRFVIYAGDEVNFICNARHAYDVAVEYLTQLAQNEDDDTRRTSCAGIAVFHSHMPFTEAYRIAKECCEGAKRWMKEQQIEHASLLDFHFCQGAIGTSLKHIRNQEENQELSLPWVIRYDLINDMKKEYITREMVEEMNLQLQKINRNNREKLFFGAKKGKYGFGRELKRLKAHHPEQKIDLSLNGKLDDEMQRKLTYDMMMVYDLWFAREEKDNGGESNGKTE